MIYWFMGYPGVGKDYCAKKLSQLLVCPHVDADDFLEESDRQALLYGTFTLQHRLKKLSRICDHIERLLKTNTNVTVADSLPEEVSRQFVYNSFRDKVRFILVQSSPKIHRKQLADRKGHFFTADLLDDYIKKHWQPLQIPHKVLVNSHDEHKELEQDLKTLIDTN